MKNTQPLFNDAGERSRMVMLVAGFALHGMISSGRSATDGGLIDDAFQVAHQFVARAEADSQ